MEILRKITVKDIVNAANRDTHPDFTLAKGKEKRFLIMTVFGRITGYRSGETQHGGFINFLGMFEAHSQADGSVFKSANLILPEPAGSVLFNVFTGNLPKKKMKTTISVQAADGTWSEKTEEREVHDFESAQANPFAFAFQIGIEPASSATGYRFTASPVDIGDDEELDPLAEIRNRARAAITANTPPLIEGTAVEKPAIEAPKGDKKKESEPA